MAAFVTLPPLPGGTSRRARPAICMKKRAGDAKKKAKAKGFTSPASKAAAPPPPPAPAPPRAESNGTPPVTESNGVPPPEDAAPAAPQLTKDLVEDTASEVGGDATPHRVLTAPRKLQDPTKELASAVVGEQPADAIELPLESVERIPWGLTADALIERFQDARSDGTLKALVAANRHHVSEALLYRFTSAIFQVEAAGRDEEASNMRELRRELIAMTWALDASFKKEVLAAEARMLPTLQAEDVSREARRRAGNNRMEVDAYWVVCYAAVAAWEERGQQNEALNQVDMQKALAQVAATCRSSSKIAESLSPCLLVAADVLKSSDQAEQAQLLSALDDADVLQLASMVEQIRLLPINAYEALRKRLATILDFILASMHQVKRADVTPLRFEPPAIPEDSNLTMLERGARQKANSINMIKFPWDR